MKIGTVYDITFSTTKVDTGVATNADSLPIVRVTENGSILPYTPTVSNLTTGLYIVTIDASLANGFEVGKRYTVYATAIVNSIAGADGLDNFIIEARSIDDVLPTASYTAPPTASAIATQVESAILNEGDGQMVIDAMVQAIGNENITASVIASQVRAELTTELGLINTNLDGKVSEAGGTGGFTEADRQMLAGKATKGDVSFSPAITFEEKQELFRSLKAVEGKEIPKTDIGPLEKQMKETNTAIANLAKPSDLKVTVNVPPDARIESIVTAISGLAPYLKPDERLESILTTLQKVTKRKIDKEVMKVLEQKMKTIDDNNIKLFEGTVKEILSTAIDELFESKMKKKTILQDKLYQAWLSSK